MQQRQGATCAWRFSMPRSTETDAEGTKETRESTEASAVLRRSKIGAPRKGAEWTWLLYHCLTHRRAERETDRERESEREREREIEKEREREREREREDFLTIKK